VVKQTRFAIKGIFRLSATTCWWTTFQQATVTQQFNLLL